MLGGEDEGEGGTTDITDDCSEGTLTQPEKRRLIQLIEGDVFAKSAMLKLLAAGDEHIAGKAFSLNSSYSTGEYGFIREFQARVCHLDSRPNPAVGGFITFSDTAYALVQFIADEQGVAPATLLKSVLPVGEDLNYDASCAEHQPFAVLLFLTADYDIANPGEGFPFEPENLRGMMRMASTALPGSKNAVIAGFIADSLLVRWDAWSPISVSVLSGRSPNGLIRVWDPSSTGTGWTTCKVRPMGQTGAWATPLFCPATSMLLRYASAHLVVQIKYKGKWHTICLLIFLLAVYCSLFCIHRQRSGATAMAFTRHAEFKNIKAAAGKNAVAPLATHATPSPQRAQSRLAARHHTLTTLASLGATAPRGRRWCADAVCSLLDGRCAAPRSLHTRSLHTRSLHTRSLHTRCDRRRALDHGGVNGARSLRRVRSIAEQEADSFGRTSACPHHPQVRRAKGTRADNAPPVAASGRPRRPSRHACPFAQHAQDWSILCAVRRRVRIEGRWRCLVAVVHRGAASVSS